MSMQHHNATYDIVNEDANGNQYMCWNVYSLNQLVWKH